MAVFNYQAGIGNAASYQVSGRPFASGSLDSSGVEALKIEFPTVTRWVYITNHDASNALQCAFSKNGLENSSKNNYFRVPARAAGVQVQVLELKVTEMYFTGSEDFDVAAGLTGISKVAINPTNWTGSLGVG